MTYCTVADVKKPLHLNADELSYDNDIADAIVSAEGMVNALAASKGLVIPFIVPPTIKDASRYIAAYLFKGPPRAPPTEKPLFMEIGLQFFEAWVATFHVGKMVSEDSST